MQGHRQQLGGRVSISAPSTHLTDDSDLYVGVFVTNHFSHSIRHNWLTGNCHLDVASLMSVDKLSVRKSSCWMSWLDQNPLWYSSGADPNPGVGVNHLNIHFIIGHSSRGSAYASHLHIDGICR